MYHLGRRDLVRPAKCILSRSHGVTAFFISLNKPTCKTVLSTNVSFHLFYFASVASPVSQRLR